MKIIITKGWAKATGKETRTFEVVCNDVNLVGARGFDSFYTVRTAAGSLWTVAAARVESIIHD
tara:strand:- start:4690 stop:4878 length:189 start_codon:yes stop_codon:yes gene_type:complete